MDVLSRTKRCGNGIKAALCGDKKDMKERLTAMIHSKPVSKKVKRFSVAVLVLVCISGVLIGAASYDDSAVSTVKAASDEATNAKNVDTDDGNVVVNTSAVTESAGNNSDSIPVASEDYGKGPDQFFWPIDAKVPATTYKDHAGNGVDLAAGGGGHPVYASAAGILVKVVEEYTGYGHHIIIDHGGGYQTLYAHLGSIDITEGDEVTVKQTIGTIGRTGNATGNYLHFEVRRDGEYMNPLDYINADNDLMVFPE